MPNFIDLHLHTNKSDGVLSPAQVLAEVQKQNLKAFAITDHDTLDGYRDVAGLVRPDDPELVPGLELSAATKNGDMHILAYLFDPDQDELEAHLVTFRQERNLRGRLMVQRLKNEGLKLSFDAVEKAAAGAAIGRPHIAEVMVAEGMVENFGMAFRRYIGNYCPAYIPKSKMSPGEAIDLIHGANGVAILAHPFINDMHSFIDELIDLKIDGLEVYHYSHSSHQIKLLKGLARKHKLVVSGGSDYHGRQEHEGEIGAHRVPSEILDRLKHRAQEIRGTG